MKTYLTLLFALVASTATVWAQNPTETADHADLRVYNNFVSRTSAGWDFNFLSISTSDLPGPTQKRARTYSFVGVEHLYLGLNGISSTGFTTRPANSLEFGFSLCGMGAYNYSRTVGLHLALYLSLSNFRLKDNDVFQVDAAGNTFCAPIDPSVLKYSRSRLKYNSWRLPITLSFPMQQHPFSLSAGIEPELRHHIRSRVKKGHTRRYDVVRNGLDINPWGFNVVAGIRYQDFSIIGRYSLTEFFDKDHTTLRGTPFMIGFMLHP